MAQGYTISVGLADNISRPLAAINKNLLAAHAPMRRLQSQIDRFKDLSGLNKISDGFKSIFRFVGRVTFSFVKMIPLLGTITSAATLGGMAKLVEAWGELGTKLLNTGAIVGASATNLQKMQNAARLAGASSDDMTSSIEGLGQAAQDALSGKNKDAMQLFQAFGVNIQKSGYQAKSGAELMGDAFDIVKRYKDSGASASVIQDVERRLGIARGMTRFAEQGRAGLAKFNAEAAHYGLLSPKAAEEADNLRSSFTKLQLAVEGFGNSIAEKVGPVLTPLITEMADLIAANRDWIATDIGKYVKEFGEWVAGSHPQIVAVVKDIRDWIATIQDIVKALGGWQSVGEAIFGMWVGAKLAKMILGIARVVVALRGASVAASAVSVAPLASSTGIAMRAVKALAAVLGTLAIPEAVIAGMGVIGAWATYKNGQTEASIQDRAARDGYTEPTGTMNEDGSFNAYRNPKTHDTKSSMNWDPRYADVIAKAEVGKKISPEMGAFLDTLAGPESGGDYSRKNGTGHFSDMSKFPEGIGPNGTSTASGKYQFTSGTWQDEVAPAIGAKDFEPHTQDVGARYLASKVYRQQTGHDLDADLKAGGHEKEIAAALNKRWPSLPGGSQSHVTETAFENNLRNAIKANQSATAAPAQAAPSEAARTIVPGVDGAKNTPAPVAPAESQASTTAPDQKAASDAGTDQAPATPAGSGSMESVIDSLRRSFWGSSDDKSEKQSAAKPAPPQNGHLTVSINAPAGWPTTARASGNAVSGAPRIVTPMDSYAMG